MNEVILFNSEGRPALVGKPRVYTDAEYMSAFISYMNAKASRIGMTNSVFESPHGQISTSSVTPVDLLKLGIYAAGYEEACRILSEKSRTFKIKGPHTRTAVIPDNGRLVTDVLLGKGGSLRPSVTHGITGYHRAEIMVMDAGGTPAVVSVMAKGSDAYDHIFDSLKEAFKLVSGTAQEQGENLDELIADGGGYAACMLPPSPSCWTNYSTAKVKALSTYVGNGEDRDCMPASTSKVMTLVCALDYMTDIHEPVTVMQNDIEDGSGSVYYAGDKMEMLDALATMTIESSNTLANTVARVTGRKILESLV